MTHQKVFRYQLVIKEHHLDTFSHVNNATNLELLEEARWEFLHAHGIDLKTIHETGIGPIVLECHIQFLKELKLRQPIIIESQMLSFEQKGGCDAAGYPGWGWGWGWGWGFVQPC